METWKEIPGYEGIYEASDLGRIRSVDRIRPHFRAGTRLLRGKVLRTNVHSNGYHSVCLADGASVKRYLVHRLIAAAFLTSDPGADHVDHIDSDRSNNAAVNLQWVSCKANNELTAARGRSTFGEKNAQAKLTDDEVRAIRQTARWGNFRRLANQYGVSVSTVSLIARGDRWGHLL